MEVPELFSLALTHSYLVIVFWLLKTYPSTKCSWKDGTIQSYVQPRVQHTFKVLEKYLPDMSYCFVGSYEQQDRPTPEDDEVVYVQLEKQDAGLGFSILDYQVSELKITENYFISSYSI